MNYSRKQLIAFGEPMGECVTRKEGGRIVYGGGGSSAPSSTTQTAELPDWARGYAKDTLAKTSALTDINQNPYQAYGANRIAGFSPLQLQAQQQAANMQTSAATGQGISIAGDASQRALGTRYDPSTFQNQFKAPGQYDPSQFQGGQFGQQEVQQYMSPYMQSVVDIQQREAQRQSDIAGTQRGAQAVGAGAFGGSRQAIMAAEAARNLAQQKGDIQAQGLQSAYQQAQSQFNADQARRMQAQQMGEQSKQYGAGLGMTGAQTAAQYGQAAQQLGEQSKQYGAGLGLQGLQTALQGAGQIGALGQQQFGQTMDINKLQNAYGGQQQALEQQGLTQAYQDFQNQQNYPYKQLGFMSDMIRGLPLGQQSTSQMYEAPGSMAGQIAGLGTGMLGLSKFMADGGSVNSYADGGSVDSQQNVANIVGQLSNEQLKQALQAAQARADMDQIEAIQREMAERASMSKGLASIPMDYEAMMPDENVGMANGGIVAFANGGESGEELDTAKAKEEAVLKGLRGLGTTFRMQHPEAYQGTLTAMEEAKQERKAAEDKYEKYMSTQPESKAFGIGAGAPTVSMARQQARENPKPQPTASTPATVPATADATVSKAEAKKVAPEVKQAVKQATAPAAISQAVDRIAEETGKPKQTLMEQYKEIEKSLAGNNKATTDILEKAEEKLKGRAEEIKGRGLGEALAAFGFNMAAEAAKPGGKLLKAAAAASPTLAKSAMENQKLQEAAQDNLAKMQIDRAKYEQAMQKQDTASATQLLAQVRQGEQHAAELAEKIKQNSITNALAERQLSQTGAYQSQAGIPAVMKIASDLQASNPELTREQALTQAARIQSTGAIERSDVANLGLFNKAVAELKKRPDIFPGMMSAEGSPERKKAEAILARETMALRQQHSIGGGEAAVPQNLIKVDNQGNIIK